MSSPITVLCTHCSSKLSLKSSAAIGKKAKCPKCQKAFVVEAPADEFGSAGDNPFGGGDAGWDMGSPMGVASGKKSGTKTSSKGKKRKGKKGSSGGWQKPVIIGGASVLAIAAIVWGVMTFTGGGGSGDEAEDEVATADSGSGGEAEVEVATTDSGSSESAGGQSPTTPENPADPVAIVPPSGATSNPMSSPTVSDDLDLAGTAVLDVMPLYPGAEIFRADVDDRGWGRRSYRCTGNDSEEVVRGYYERVLVEQEWTIDVKPNEFFTNSIEVTATKENLTVTVSVDDRSAEGTGIFFVTRVNEGDGIPSPSGLPGVTLQARNEPDMEGTHILDDVPLYPGGTLFNAVVFDDSVNKYAIRIYTTPDALETVGRYYTRVLSEAGWTIHEVIPEDNSRLGYGGYKVQAYLGERMLWVLAFTDEDADTNKIQFTAAPAN